MKQTEGRKSKKVYEPIVDLDGEVWKDVVGYEGLYQVSNKGRVKSLNYHSTNRPSLLRHDIRKEHHRVTLCKDNKTKKIFVHRLVYKAFNGILPEFKYMGKGNGDKMFVINHKDENPHNNCAENLEVVTSTENNRYGTSAQRTSKTKTIPVFQYSLDGEFIKKWEYSKEFKEKGFLVCKVHACCKKERLTHKGFIWSFHKMSKQELLEFSKMAIPKLNKHLVRKVYQYTLDGKLVNIWNNEAEPEKFGFSQACISNCCIGKQTKHKGHIWSFKALQENELNKIKEKVLNINSEKKKKVYQYTLDFELIKIWTSETECQRNGFRANNISSCCLGKRKTYKGFIWRFTPLFENN